MKAATEKTIYSYYEGDSQVIVVLKGGTTEAHAQKIADLMEELLSAGVCVTKENGDRVWRERVVEVNKGRYTWHEDGERIRCLWQQVTVCAEGNETRRTLRKVWVGLQNALD